MINILFFIAGIALGIWIKGRDTKASHPAALSFEAKEPKELEEIQEKAKEAITERTDKRKEKILYLMNSEAVHQNDLKACGVADIKQGITRLNVEKFLDVSDATALKYLNELESENKIKQVGDRGRDVYYTLN